MIKFEDLNREGQIKADLYSRPNALNGKYRVGELELHDLVSNDIFFLETLKMRANLADKMIAEAESEGKNTLDSEVMKELGRKINAMGTPQYRWEPIMTTVFNSIGLMLYYGIALGIWGLVFSKSFLIFSLFGCVVGLLISLLFGSIVAFQRTKEKTKEMSFAVGHIWGNLGIVVGIIGLVFLIIKLIFFG